MKRSKIQKEAPFPLQATSFLLFSRGTRLLGGIT